MIYMIIYQTNGKNEYILNTDSTVYWSIHYRSPVLKFPSIQIDIRAQSEVSHCQFVLKHLLCSDYISTSSVGR